MPPLIIARTTPLTASVMLLSTLASAQTNSITGAVALREARVSVHVRNDIVAFIARGISGDVGVSQAQEIALDSWVSFPKLDRNGTLIIQVEGGPENPDNGATGNVPIWLFKQVGIHAFLILEGSGYTSGPASKVFHQGMLDFQTTDNVAAGQGGVEVFRFDGKRYKSDYCYTYSEDNHGNVQYGPHRPCPR